VDGSGLPAINSTQTPFFAEYSFYPVTKFGNLGGIKYSVVMQMTLELCAKLVTKLYLI